MSNTIDTHALEAAIQGVRDPNGDRYSTERRPGSLGSLRASYAPPPAPLLNHGSANTPTALSKP